jgi:hypothetical protein
MNNLEQKLRMIFERAMVDVGAAVASARGDEIGTLFQQQAPRPQQRPFFQEPQRPVPASAKASVKTKTKAKAKVKSKPKPAMKAAPKPIPKKKPKKPTITRAVMNEKVLEAVATAPNPLGLGEIAKELGLPPDSVAPSLVALRGAGKIDKRGDKRTATYVPVGHTIENPAQTLGEDSLDVETAPPVNNSSKEITTNRYAPKPD